ncbi:MAG: NAD-dependent epimerase/dehydratase family protein, partial [Pseudomonadota bacterium]
MRVLILGGAGMIGRTLADRLSAVGAVGGTPIEEVTLFDIVAASPPENAAFPVKIETGDLLAEGQAARLLAAKPDVIFHLAAVVSGQAEEDFDLGYR